MNQPIKLIRSLVFPWFVYFVALLGAVIVVGLKLPKYQHLLHLHQGDPRPAYFILGISAGLCVMANLRSLAQVGIWLSESLPDSLRYGSWNWLMRAVKAAVIAAAFWFVGQFSWMPLIWQAAVIPFIFTICLFVVIWSLVGPILKFSSNLAWSHAFSVIFSLPVFALVPVTSLFLGQTFVAAYFASQPEMVHKLAVSAEPIAEEPIEITARVLSLNADQVRIWTEWPVASGKKKVLEVKLTGLRPDLVAALPKVPSGKDLPLKLLASAMKEAPTQTNPEKLNTDDIDTRLRSLKPDKRASALREIYEARDASGQCSTYSKEILAALDVKGAKEPTLWALKAIDCAGFRAVVAVPKLATLMAEHKDAEVRALAIRSLKKFGNENVRQISYLLSKRLTDREDKQVIDATAALLAPLGGDEVRWSANKLKALLGNSETSSIAANALIKDYSRDDLVAEFVAEHLTSPEDVRGRTVAMICLLPEAKRAVAEPYIDKIVEMIGTADENDPAIKALNCMGQVGFKAIREEMNRPHRLDRPVAARALAELDIKGVPEAIDVAGACAHDGNEQVRKWCSQSLGRIGLPALPKIIELLKSNDSSLKESGRLALENFDDANARSELLKIRDANSGWMANNHKLQIAKAVGTALNKIESAQALAASHEPQL